jgi:hypothetical protein
MKHTPNPIILLILLLVIAGMLSYFSKAEACERDNSFGCELWVDCYVCDGGYCWIRGKK